VPVPPEKQLLVLGAALSRFQAPETDGQNEKHMYLNRITLIGFLGGDAEKKVSNATNIAVFSLATRTSWKNDAGTWESRTEWHRCVAFGKLAGFAATLTKGTHVAVEGELRSHEYPRDIALGAHTTSIAQRDWEIRVDSVLKLDRAARLASHRGGRGQDFDRSVSVRLLVQGQRTERLPYRQELETGR
jgi:single-strand DNA-binding protein